MEDFAAIDFETANNERTSVCSVGVVIVRNGEIVDSFYSLIQPEPNYYNYWCSQVHGLTREDTEDAPVFPKVWKQIEPLIEGLPLVAHNKAFDESYMCGFSQGFSTVTQPSTTYSIRILWLSPRQSSSCPRRCRGLRLDCKRNPVVINFSTPHYYTHIRIREKEKIIIMMYLQGVPQYGVDCLTFEIGAILPFAKSG